MPVGKTQFEGHEIVYETFGEGKRVVLLVHGLLMSRKMQEPIARALAKQGNMCITTDLAGHGASGAHLYNWDTTTYAAALDALLTDLGVDQAVVLGTSLGANIALQLACEHPERVRGLVIEMPALENAMIGGPLFFMPFAALSQWARPVANLISKAARTLPEIALPMGANMLIELIRRDPGSTIDIMKGLFYGPIAPHRELRQQITQPTLVIAHHFDPIHPYNDANDLAEDIEGAQLIEATTVVELRLTPSRLTKRVIAFVDRCWEPQVIGKNGRARPRRSSQS